MVTSVFWVVRGDAEGLISRMVNRRERETWKGLKGWSIYLLLPSLRW